MADGFAGGVDVVREPTAGRGGPNVLRTLHSSFCVVCARCIKVDAFSDDRPQGDRRSECFIVTSLRLMVAALILLRHFYSDVDGVEIAILTVASRAILAALMAI